MEASDRKVRKGNAPAFQHPLYVAPHTPYVVGASMIRKKDMSRFIHWPVSVRLQRQRRVLMQRLKIPAAINQFSHTLDRNQALTLLKLLHKYRWETAEERSARLTEVAKDHVEKGKNAMANPKAKSHKELVGGIVDVVKAIETKTAKLVVIAHDVVLVEQVVWLPALCRKMDVPYCIVKSTARLGQLVSATNTPCVAVVDVRKEDAAELENLAKSYRVQFNDNVDVRRTIGGGLVGAVKIDPITRKIYELEEHAHHKKH